MRLQELAIGECGDKECLLCKAVGTQLAPDSELKTATLHAIIEDGAVLGCICTECLDTLCHCPRIGIEETAKFYRDAKSIMQFGGSQNDSCRQVRSDELTDSMPANKHGGVTIIGEVAPQEELWQADPNCVHNIVSAPGGGVRCTKCHGWFCY